MITMTVPFATRTTKATTTVFLIIGSLFACDHDQSNKKVSAIINQHTNSSRECSHNQKRQIQSIKLDLEQLPFPSNESLLSIGSWTVDRSAYVGLPRILADNATNYVSKVLQIVGLNKSPTRIVYKRDEFQNGTAVYPLSVSHKETGREPVTVTLLPSPELLHAVQQWAKINMWGEIQDFSVFDLLDEKVVTTNRLGYTLYFTPGSLSEEPIRTPALPYGTDLSAGIFIYSNSHLKTRKIVFRSSDHNNEKALEPLAFGRNSGAIKIGSLTTIPFTPENDCLRMVHLHTQGQQSQSWLAYSLADACGAMRAPVNTQLDGTSRFERPLSSQSHNPKLGRHSLLRIPKPLDLNTRSAPHEELSLDECFFSNNSPGVLVANEAGSKPFRESLIFTIEPGELKPEDKLHLIALFPNAPPENTIPFMLGVINESFDEKELHEKMLELNEFFNVITLQEPVK